MKLFKIYQLLFVAVLAVCFAACSDDKETFEPVKLEGTQAFFPPTLQTNYEVEGTEGSFEVTVMRATTGAAQTAISVEGDTELITVPAILDFAADAQEAKLTVNYKNLVRGAQSSVKITLGESTPYGVSTVTLNVLYPNEVVEEWEVVSEEAVLIDQLFSMYGVTDLTISGLTVEKEKNSNKYRFRSPYDADYFMYVYGLVLAFPEELPYIVLDGETYKDKAPGQFYIPGTALGFQMVNGQGPKVDSEWNTFGSWAGNIKNSAGLIEPGNPDYPMVTYMESAKMFDFGVVYHNLGGYGPYEVDGGFALYLDPALMAPDFDRDYTWTPVEDATGFFTSEIAGENWMQDVEQAEEDPTFFRFPSLYAEDVHIYFNYDAESGRLTMPKMQPTGLSTYGNVIYVDAVANECGVDKDDLFTFVLSFYLADKEGNKTAELMQATETFTWGRGPLDLLQKGKKIDDYVGTWAVPLTDGDETLSVPVVLTKADESTLLVQGLCPLKDYDDTMALGYDSESGLLIFGAQQVASIGGFPALVVPFNAAEGKLTTSSNELLVGGLTNDGVLKFVNNPDNQGTYDSMAYLYINNGYYLMSGFWNWLEWTPVAPATGASFGSLNKVDFANGCKAVKEGIASKRTYKTELNLKASPVQPRKISLKVDKPAQGFSVVR